MRYDLDDMEDLSVNQAKFILGFYVFMCVWMLLHWLL